MHIHAFTANILGLERYRGMHRILGKGATFSSIYPDLLSILSCPSYHNHAWFFYSKYLWNWEGRTQDFGERYLGLYPSWSLATFKEDCTKCLPFDIWYLSTYIIQSKKRIEPKVKDYGQIWCAKNCAGRIHILTLWALYGQRFTSLLCSILLMPFLFAF